MQSDKAAGFSWLWFVLAGITILYAGLTVLPFLTDGSGQGTQPDLSLVLSGVLLAGLAGFSVRERLRLKKCRERYDPQGSGLAVVALASGVTFLYCLAVAQPFHNLPVGITSDAVHHYVLTDYIATHRQLPLNSGGEERARLVEMATYPPAFHLVAAQVARFSGGPLAYVLFPLAAFFAALANGATAAVAYTLMRPSPWRPLWSLLAAFATFFAYGFAFDTFMYWDFYGQLAGQAALALGLYFALHYGATGYRPSLLFGTLAGLVLVLGYTHWLPVLGLALVGVIIFRGGLPGFTNQRTWREKTVLAAGVGLPLGLVAFLFLKDRAAGGQSVWTAGRNFSAGEINPAWLVPVAIAGLVVLLLVIAFGQRYGAANRRRLAGYGGGLLLAGLSGGLLLQVGFALSSFGLGRLFPAEPLLGWLLVPAGLGWLLAVFKNGPARLYPLFLAAAALEVLAYLVLKPGGETNSYHLSKLYAVILVALLPPLVALPLEFVFQELPARLLARFRPDRPEGAEGSKRRFYALSGLSLLACIGLAFFTYNQLNANSPDRSHVYAGPDLVVVAGDLRREGIDPHQVGLSVQEGVPAYFTYVGLLGLPRDSQAEDYYRSTRRSFESWLYNPSARPYMLTDQWDVTGERYPSDKRFRVIEQRGKVALLERSPDYMAELQARHTLYLYFRGEVSGPVLTVNLEIAGAQDALADLQPVLALGPLQPSAAPLLVSPLYKRELPPAKIEQAYGWQNGYLKIRLAEGYSRGAFSGQDVPPDNFKFAPGRYSLWVQLWKNGRPVIQRKVQDFDYSASGEASPLPSPDPLPEQGPVRSGQLLLEAPVLSQGPVLTPANTFFQSGELRLLQITGWAFEQPSYQPGEVLRLRQRYLAAGNLPVGYVVFVHLLDAKGAVVAQSDFEPAGGLYPTWLWRKDQEVTFDQELKLPPGLPPGRYSLELGLYSEPGQQRLETWFYEPYINRIWENRFYVKDALEIK